MSRTIDCLKCSADFDAADLEVRWGWYYCPTGHRVAPAYETKNRHTA